MNIKKYITIAGLVLLIVVIATGIDWVVHSSRDSFYVPLEYYRNKIIFATLFGLGALIVFRKQNNLRLKAVLFSLIIAVLLQIKYFTQGYDLFFVFLFLGLHFLMFLFPAYYIFRKYPKYFR